MQEEEHVLNKTCNAICFVAYFAVLGILGELVNLVIANLVTAR